MSVTTGNAGLTVLILNIAKPVSVNHYLTRTFRGATLSAEAVIFKETLSAAIVAALVSDGVRGLVYDKDGKKVCRVTMTVWMAVHRTTDLANLDKLLSDTLNGLIWRDDSQVDTMQMHRVPVGKNQPERLTVFLEVHQPHHIPTVPTSADVVIDAAHHHAEYTQRLAALREHRAKLRERRKERANAKTVKSTRRREGAKRSKTS